MAKLETTMFAASHYSNDQLCIDFLSLHSNSYHGPNFGQIGICALIFGYSLDASLFNGPFACEALSPSIERVATGEAFAGYGARLIGVDGQSR